ncbi:MAG TPA: NAD(P)H-dependent oxidoreductase [Gemmatimonadales bacterium]|nr:NAD(P)H-dependent oxidoreductase [Gemmatimonadales bacterium]
MKVLAFAASLRKESHNRRLAALAARYAGEAGAEVDLADFADFRVPLYDGDVERTAGLPPGARELIRRAGPAAGLLIASPEYNYSLPGTLKNLIDWVSRAKPNPLRGKSALLLAASTSGFGGIRGLWQLRIPLEGMGVFVHPDMFALPNAARMFDDRGELTEPERAERLRNLVRGYLSAARALARRD